MSFGVALHTMVALAYNEGEFLSSSALAVSIGANPVTVRRVVGQLSEAGLVETQPGPGGGARLARSPKKVSVTDVYDAIGQPSLLTGHDKEPNAVCAVSLCMPRVFARLNDEIEERARDVMGDMSLHTILQEELEG